MLRKLFVPLSALVLMFSLASCAPSTANAGQEKRPASEAPGVIVLDVRTPQEYDEGHLEGAVRLDLNGGEFASALPDLDTGAEYLVYCRSGSRSCQAVAMMQEVGITGVTNLGSLEEAAGTTGLPIVTP